MFWTDSQVTLLITLWNQGKTSAQIAVRFPSLGRDTVLEKIELMKLKRPARHAVTAPSRRAFKSSAVSSLGHSPRYKMALTGQAKRRVEQQVERIAQADLVAGRDQVAYARKVRHLTALMSLDRDLFPQIDARTGAHQELSDNRFSRQFTAA
ncbi:MAG: hypothetical protein EOP94_01205 [Zymomonas sp.]|nr:MAG: hypothetical protein EOP94_01205 [Zymomonas sp.]